MSKFLKQLKQEVKTIEVYDLGDVKYKLKTSSRTQLAIQSFLTLSIGELIAEGIPFPTGEEGNNKFLTEVMILPDEMGHKYRTKFLSDLLTHNGDCGELSEEEYLVQNMMDEVVKLTLEEGEEQPDVEDAIIALYMVVSQDLTSLVKDPKKGKKK